MAERKFDVLRERSGGASAVARRIGSRVGMGSEGLRPAAKARRAWTLRIVPFFLVVALLTNLILGRVQDVLGLVAALLLCYGGVVVLEAGLRAEADYAARALTRAPRLPRKLIGSLVIGVGIFIASLLGSGADVAQALLFGAVATGGAVLAYGPDPRKDKGLAPTAAVRAGVRTEAVIETLREAEAKVVEIEQAAARLHNPELTRHLRLIVGQARAILRQIEEDPGDIRRARRFLVTYLDGTRDVVSKYARQQKDLESTPLADNFRRVLESIEAVFEEQQAVLKRNESLDLEVQIEALQTQLQREGVA
jgi:hypothetical protein